MDRLKLYEFGKNKRKEELCEAIGVTMPTVNKILDRKEIALRYAPDIMDHLKTDHLLIKEYNIKVSIERKLHLMKLIGSRKGAIERAKRLKDDTLKYTPELGDHLKESELTIETYKVTKL